MNTMNAMTEEINQNHANLNHLSRADRAALPDLLAGFIDSAATGMARAGFYSAREEQEAGIVALHRKLIAIDRGVYAAVLLLPGVTDYSRQLAVAKLLSTPRNGHSVLNSDQETWAVRKLTTAMPPPRMLKTFVELQSY